MMERNVALLEKTMQHIKDHPEQHNQRLWVNKCGTAACFAGWAAILSGVDSKVCYDNPSKMPFIAEQLLGIDPSEAGLLFMSDNTIPMLELMVKDLVNGDEMRPQDAYANMTQEGS